MTGLSATTSAEGQEPKLRVVEVIKRFASSAAVDGVSLEVARGEIVALLGPSGSGKTTLLKMIGGHEHPDAGDILIDGRSVVGLPANRIPTATVFQNYALFPHYDVFQNVAFGLRMRGVAAREIQNRIASVLALVGLTGFERRDVTTLSGGEKQRIATARALAVEPEIVLMDEPLGALDRLIRLRMQRELGDLLRRVGVTTVYVTHNQHEALTMADRVVVMERGKLRQIGTPLEIYRQPRSHFVATFMGDANFLPGVVSEVKGDLGSVAVGDVAVTGQFVRGQLADPGAAVTAMLRPENVQMVAGHDNPGWYGRIVTAVFSGEMTEYTVDVQHLSGPVRVKALGAPLAAGGDPVALTWHAEDVVILPNGEPREAWERE